MARGQGGYEEILASLKALAADDGFHGALEYPHVMKAVNHWSGKNRLAAEECEEWASDPKVMFVMGQMRRLQHACKLAGFGLPLDSILEKRASFNLPDGRHVGANGVVSARETKAKEAPVAKVTVGKKNRLRCTCSSGVAYRRSASLNDRDSDQRGPQLGEVVIIDERQGEWVQTAAGWLPLRTDGMPLFEIAAAEEDGDDEPASLWDGLRWKVAIQLLPTLLAAFAVKYAMPSIDGDLAEALLKNRSLSGGLDALGHARASATEA